jgi:hypothetical protein
MIAHREALDQLYPRHPWVFDSKRRRLLLKDIITGSNFAVGTRNGRQ